MTSARPINPDGEAASHQKTTDDTNPIPQNSKRRYAGNKKLFYSGPSMTTPNWSSHQDWSHGRVLNVEYASHKPEDRGRVTSSSEINDINGLKSYYEEQNRDNDMKVIHVQNAPWAARFLKEKYAIGDHADTILGLAPIETQGGRPQLSGGSFEMQIDHDRGITQSAFHIDYLKLYEAGFVNNKDNLHLKLQELNEYAPSGPSYSHDVFVQRIGVYVQAKVDPGTKSAEMNAQEPQQETTDDENTIIFIDNSASGSRHDTLVPARSMTEVRLRRVYFNLHKDLDPHAPTTLDVVDFILIEILKALADTWKKYNQKASSHVLILQDRFYQNPTDASRAPELWAIINHFVRIQRTIYVHSNILRSVKSLLNEMFFDAPYTDAPEWLGSMQEEYDRLNEMITGDLVRPTNNISEQMYQAIAFRDSRDSLQFNASLWRLSWITFIFLPLNFVNAFFGMNVDLFASFPSVKYYFISSVAFMLLVLLAWQLTRVLLAHSERFRHAPYAQSVRSRGIYKGLYHDLAQHHPGLWTRSGPRSDVGLSDKSRPFVARLKWRLLMRWFAPESTIYVSSGEFQLEGRPITRTGTAFDAGIGTTDDKLGIWGTFKRWCARRWLKELDSLSNPQGAAKA